MALKSLPATFSRFEFVPNISKTISNFCAGKKPFSSMTKRSNAINGHQPIEVNEVANDQKPRQPTIVKVRRSKVKSASILSAKFLLEGQVVALPTDTVYGLAALVQNRKAVQQLYTIKGRNCSKPIAICVAEIADVYRWGEVNVPSDLLEKLLPGPVTLCFQRKPELNPEFNPGAPLVGIRIPDHDLVREVCQQMKQMPLALTSANISSTSSTLEVGEFETLFPHLGAVFDGGKLGDTQEARDGSTVVDLSKEGSFKIIREGCANTKTVSILKQFGLQELK